VTIVSAASKPLVDWAGLGKVFLVAALFGVGIVVLMSIAIRMFSLEETGGSARKIVTSIAGGISLLIVLAAVGFGIYIMMQK